MKSMKCCDQSCPAPVLSPTRPVSCSGDIKLLNLPPVKIILLTSAAAKNIPNYGSWLSRRTDKFSICILTFGPSGLPSVGCCDSNLLI